MLISTVSHFPFLLHNHDSLLTGSLFCNVAISLIACRRHFTNSVGHRVSEEKNAAKNPADALLNVDKFSIFCKNIRVH